jgi:AcrR family transcriptional regulator
MERKNFPEITVAEIVEKAHSSVGVFYSRFPDKLALLHYLDERFAEEAGKAIDRRLHYGDWKNSSFAAASGEVIDFLCRSHYEKRGMLKSIILQVRMHPNQRFQQTGKRLIDVLDRVTRFLLNWRNEIGDPHPERTLRLALVMVMVISTIRDCLVFFRNHSVPGIRRG